MQKVSFAEFERKKIHHYGFDPLSHLQQNRQAHRQSALPEMWWVWAGA